MLDVLVAYGMPRSKARNALKYRDKRTKAERNSG